MARIIGNNPFGLKNKNPQVNALDELSGGLTQAKDPSM